LKRILKITGSISFENTGLARERNPKYANGRTTQYAYDPVHLLTAVIDPLCHITNSSYDAAGNTTSYRYDATSNLANMTYPNGMETGYTYDNANRLVNLVNRQGASVVSGYTYTLDANGNRLQVTETGLNSSSLAITYGYDVLSRLHIVTNSGKTVTYMYDPMGNRLNVATNATETTKDRYIFFMIIANLVFGFSILFFFQDLC